MSGKDGSLVAETLKNAAVLKESGVGNMCVKVEKKTLNAEGDGIEKLDKSTIKSIVGKDDADGVVEKAKNDTHLLGQRSRSSDLISFSQVGLRGPMGNKQTNKKKALVNIYESLRIPYAPSYFTALIHS